MIFTGMSFTIHPKINGRIRSFQVEKTETTQVSETYRISSGDHSVTIQNNRLFFRSRRLMSRNGTWKIVDGLFKTESARVAICDAIEKADPQK
jgi:hypothetical protein